MRVLLLAILTLTLVPAAGALPSPIPTECSFAPVAVCAVDQTDGCVGETAVGADHGVGYVSVAGTDTCGVRTIRIAGSNGATGFFAFAIVGDDETCTVSGAFVVSVFPATDCSAVGAPPNPGWGELLP